MYTAAGNFGGHLSGSSSGAAVRNPTIPYPFHHYHQQQQQQEVDDDEFPRRDERSPQWSNQETRDFIEIRAQLEWGFTAPNRDDNLWEMIASRMREKGYWRTAHQCRCKWENLVTRYKGDVASDVVNVQPCPFFNEVHAFFMMKANRMMAGGIAKGQTMPKIVSEDISQEEFTEEQEDEEEEEEIIVVPKRKEKKRKMGEKEDNCASKNGSDVLKGVAEMMRNFMVQQEWIDMQWREVMEKKAEERDAFEQKWRQKMETLERERLMMERAWREREEERKLREERRAEKRDALLSILLNKLINDESPLT